MSDIMWTRYGGKVQLFLFEAGASGAASLDHWTAKFLIELGHKIHVYGNLSEAGKKYLKETDEEWTKNIIYHDHPVVEVPDYISHVIVSQGSDNMRFGGVLGVSSQLWLYRLLRNCKVPVIYQQYDAYTPLYHNPYKSNDNAAVYGCSLREVCKNRVFIMAAGQDKEAIWDIGYRGSGDTVKVITWKNDIHQIATPFIDHYSLEPKSESEVEKGICFIGKDRRGGSRGPLLMELDKVLSEQDDESLVIHLYGDWEDLVKDKEYKRLIPKGVVKGGSEPVIATYNKYEFGLIHGNAKYIELKQYTVRLFEVLAGGTIPIFQKEWYDTWKHIFSEDMQKYIEENLCYSKVEDVPGLIKKFRESGVSRALVAKRIRNDVRSMITDDMIKKDLQDMLDYTASQPIPTKEQADELARGLLKLNYELRSKAKNKGLNAKAQPLFEARTEFEFGGPDGEGTLTKINRENNIKECFLFTRAAKTPEEELRKWFGR